MVFANISKKVAKSLTGQELAACEQSQWRAILPSVANKPRRPSSDADFQEQLRAAVREALARKAIGKKDLRDATGQDGTWAAEFPKATKNRRANVLEAMQLAHLLWRHGLPEIGHVMMRTIQGHGPDADSLPGAPREKGPAFDVPLGSATAAERKIRSVVALAREWPSPALDDLAAVCMTWLQHAIPRYGKESLPQTGTTPTEGL